MLLKIPEYEMLYVCYYYILKYNSNKTGKLDFNRKYRISDLIYCILVC